MPIAALWIVGFGRPLTRQGLCAYVTAVGKITRPSTVCQSPTGPNDAHDALKRHDPALHTA
eukprot:14021737-Alexandrium_andersonii.AAC.1